MPSRERVAALIRRVEQGRYVEALEEFYADDATMQENGNPPRVGLKALIAHERSVMAAFKEIRTLPVKSWLVDGDRVVIHWIFEFRRPDGTRFRMDELAHQLWRGDRVAEERFYYDPAQLVVAEPTSPA